MTIDMSVRSFVNQIRDKYEYDERVENAFVIFFKDGKVVFEEVVGTGTEHRASFDLKKVLREGIVKDADSMIFLHNHTSDDLSPSGEDIEVTDILITLCYLLDIHFIAHIVFNESEESIIYVGDFDGRRRNKKGKGSS